MVAENSGNVTADAHRVTFLKCKMTAIWNKVARLVDSLSSSKLVSFDLSVFRVRLIDKLQQTFRKFLNELE